jgi:hypothetical protein
MRRNLWQVLSRGWHRVFGEMPARNRAVGRSAGDDSRARFWAEFREGQREAEARSMRQRPS